MGKFYVTTAIDYANAPPHLGQAYEKTVADVLARFHRSRGDETFFLTGTDEHGAKISRAAETARIPVADFVDSKREDFKKLLKVLNISNDDFIFTEDKKRHWPGVEKMWRAIESAGDFYKASYRGLYCVGHEAFVTAKDLKNGLCIDHNQRPEVIEEANYFFRLSKYTAKIKEAIESDAILIQPEIRKNEVLAFLKEGVEDVSFSRPTRDIPWGIPVHGDPGHTIYVWAEALINYISALGYGSSDESKFKKFWPADLHVIGKDILRFHAVIFPGMLMAAGLPLPKKIFVHGMILSGGHKMSKTIGNVINPLELIKTYGEDATRYFLMREIPSGGDGDFTLERFREVYEGNLAHGLGNLVSRTAAMIQKYFDGKVKRPSDDVLAFLPTKRMLRGASVKLKADSLERCFELGVRARVIESLDNIRLTEAITMLFDFFSLLDGYIQDYEPFRLVKTDREKAGGVLWNVAEHLLKSASLLEPFLPKTSQSIQKSFIRQENGVIFVSLSESLFPSHKK